MRRFVILIIVVLSACSAGLSQAAMPATGLYQFGAFDNGAVDSINRGNLNIHLAFPILSKPGRNGTDFNYVLNYDGLVWNSYSSIGLNSWLPAPDWGWTTASNAEFGFVSYNFYSGPDLDCGPKKPIVPTSIYDNFIYHDKDGISHPFAFSFAGTCLTPDNPFTGSGTYGVGDGYGYTIYRNARKFVALTKTGGQFSVAAIPFYEGSIPSAPNASGVYTDTNGNQISASSSGVFTDTLGKTALTVSGAAPNPVTYSYTDTTGATRNITVNYIPYTVTTHFGVSGIAEFSQANVALISSIVYPDGNQYAFTYEPTPGNASSVTGRIASVTLRTGGTVGYTYTGGNGGIFLDGTTSGLTRTTSDGTVSYVRSGVTSAASTTTYTDALGNASVSSFLENPQGYIYETSRARYSGAPSGTPLQQITTCYVSSSGCTSNSVQFPIQYQITTLAQDGVQIGTDTKQFSGNGLLLSDNNGYFNEVTAYQTFTGSFGIPFTRPSSRTDLVSSTQTAFTSYTYDVGIPLATSGVPQHGPAASARGNLTTLSQWNNLGVKLDTVTTYEDTGNPLTTTTPNGQSTYTYDTATHTFLSVSAPPTPSSGVSLLSQATYDSNTGLPLTATDPNNAQVVYKSYDSMMRPLEIDYPDGGITTYQYPFPYEVSETRSMSGSNNATTWTMLDGYGRMSRTAVNNGQGSNSWYQADYCYDSNGRLQFKSYAYQGAGFAQAKVCSGLGDTYSYDALGRVITISHQDNTTIQSTYTGRATRVVDENGVNRITQVDLLGRKTAVCEISSNVSMPASGSPATCVTDIPGTGFVTSYGYDLINHKTTVTQGAQTRVFQTDSLGRTVGVQEPESSAPTTFSYVYNGAGLVVTRQRPQANQTSSAVFTTTTSQYDSVSRLLSVNYSDGITPTKSFSYDAGGQWSIVQSNLKGRLSVAQISPPTITAGTAFSYDAMGRVVLTAQCFPSGCGTPAKDKHLAYSYDGVGNMLTAQDGASATNTYTYSAASEVTSITSSLSDATHPATLVSNVQNGPNGPLTFQMGNGANAVNAYDPLGRRWAGWVCNNGSFGNFCGDPVHAVGQAYGFTIGMSGTRITSACDTSLNRCEGFGYDEFNRLASQTVYSGTVKNFTYVYDRYGNRWQQNAFQGGFAPKFSFDPTTNKIITAGYQYDAAGNLINDTFHAYQYDAEGNMIKVDNGATASYIFDALKRRVRANVGPTGSNPIEYAFNPNGQRASSWNATLGGWMEGQTYWGSMPVEFYSGGVAHFQHQDWMGTERVRTTYNGAGEGTFQSLPFGDGLTTGSGSDNDAYHFAQLDHDYYSNTDHAQLRQYSSTQGRWLSPDPYSGSYSFSNPQSLNRYAYTANSPVSSTDPSGLKVVDCVWTGCSHGGPGGGSGGGSWGAGGYGGGYTPTSIIGGSLADSAAQAETDYAAQVFLAFKLASEDLNKGPKPNTGACIAAGIQSFFGGSASITGVVGETGGHWNFNVVLTLPSAASARSFQNLYDAGSRGFGPPARFGPGPAIHFENVSTPSPGVSNTYIVSGSSHIDLYSPDTGLGGIAGHIGADYVGGHVVQLMGGNIDPSSCPF